MPKKRGKGKKQVKPVLHIFCEGNETERNYLNGYLNEKHPNNRRLKVVKVEKTNKNTPVQLVQEAMSLQNQKNTPRADVFWVVYDRESVNKYSNDLHKQSLDLAAANNIGIALTNVCFEMWLLLHFEYTTAQYQSCEDLLNRSPLKNSLQLLGVNDYQKADDTLFELLSDKVDNARLRAARVNSQMIDASGVANPPPYTLNPYTGMHNLLDAIDSFVDAYK